MKKLIAALICIMMVIGMTTPTVAFAQEVSDAEQIIELGAADDAALSADSYTITDDGETLLEVRHVDEPGMTAALDNTPSNGYYTADFMLPETNYHVYLTGLTRENTDEIRQAIIDAYDEGADFELTNLGFIDAEKTWYEDGDENLCWAAASSNLLNYTGWAAQAGFTNTDDLFEAFIDAFSDDGGNVRYGVGWFLNGVSSIGGAQPDPGTGGYLRQYNYSDVAKIYDIYENGIDQFKTVYERMKNGYGVSLSVDIYGEEGYQGGHSVSCWGFVTDIRYPEDSKAFFKSVFVTDSDSDKYWVQEGTDRRDADDVMSLCALETFEQNGIETYQFNITDHQIALISELITVAPFSEDFPHETLSSATLDLVNSPDIVIDPFILTDEFKDDVSTKTIFSPDATIYYHPYMFNVSNATYTGPLYLTVTVTNEQGNTVYSKNFNYSSTIDIDPSYMISFSRTGLNKTLPVGDYTITATFNRNHVISEVYYFNNSKSISFKVRDTYLSGDTDGNGAVESVDTTTIQRILAKLDVQVVVDENLICRGDITQEGILDLMDVTLIQRYLAHAETPYAVNESRFYE